MQGGKRADSRECWWARQDTLGVIWMQPHLLPFPLRERAWFCPDARRNAHAAEVMQHPRPPEHQRFRLTQPTDACRSRGEFCDAGRMTKRVRRLDIGKIGQRLTGGI